MAPPGPDLAAGTVGRPTAGVAARFRARSKAGVRGGPGAARGAGGASSNRYSPYGRSEYPEGSGPPGLRRSGPLRGDDAHTAVSLLLAPPPHVARPIAGYSDIEVTVHARGVLDEEVTALSRLRSVVAGTLPDRLPSTQNADDRPQHLAGP